ncbi:parvulin-like peptidyl-prolyl isomerase [Desulfosporosinus youngiae DSM 17734]|uniref:Parvulin-like peptidyl-prolyl isomerase n=2 Tax=Desulfosporosinus TaxID=79206 RepID=H5XRP9_9FIRM|nr:parvulin-like peptidyl-prolyl isomerase [Desulfosporosinus youngiae DSM 17734]
MIYYSHVKLKGCVNMKKPRVGFVFGVLALMIMTTGCSSLVGGKWAVKVNETPILVKDYDVRVSEAQKVYEKQGMKFDTDQGKEALPQIKSMLLERMIEGELIAQEVKNLSLNSEDAKVKEQEEIIKKNMGNEATFQDTLKQQGMTEPELRNFLMVYEKVTGDVNVNETEVKAFFDKNISYYSQPESVKARHILVKTEDEAKAIIAQLSAGADFEQLAKEKSIEPGAKESGGDLGTFTKGRMVPEFEAAAFAQKVGTFSTAPVKTEFGYHVIKVEEHTVAAAPEYAKVQGQVGQDALNQAKDAKFQTYFDELRKNAKIEYSQGYKPAS